MIEFVQGSVREAMVALHDAQTEPQYKPGTDDILPALGRLAERPVFDSLLHQLIASDEWLAQVARMSYSHALGFDKIVIMSMQPLGRLRLHIWWPSAKPIVEHPHNHRYSSHSAVVVGKLCVQMHMPGDNGSIVQHYREGSSSSDDCWSFTKLGATHLTTKMAVEVCPGASYSMSADMVHHINSPDGLTVTLFLEMERVGNWSDVFVRPGDPIPESQAQQLYGVSELQNRLRRLQVVLQEFP